MSHIETNKLVKDFLAGKIDLSDYANMLDPRGAGIYPSAIIKRQIKELLWAIEEIAKLAGRWILSLVILRR